MVYSEGHEYPEYVMHSFHLKYSGTPAYGTMLGNSRPVGPVKQTTENYRDYSGCPQQRHMLCIPFCCFLSSAQSNPRNAQVIIATAQCSVIGNSHGRATKTIGHTYHPNNTNGGRRVELLWSQIQKLIAEADPDLIPVPGQVELHGRCRCLCLALSMLWCSICVADQMLGMELELRY